MSGLERGSVAASRVRQSVAQYEPALVAQAREIALGQSQEPATPEHLRILLCWLDGHAMRPEGATTH